MSTETARGQEPFERSVMNDPPGIKETITRSSVSGTLRGQRRVSLQLRDSTVKYAIWQVARQAGLRVVYDNRTSAIMKRISIQLSDVSAMSAFSQILVGTGLEAKLAKDGETVLIRAKASDSIHHQDTTTGSIQGRIIDSTSGAGIGGVSITLDPGSVRTVSSENGTFVFNNVHVGNHIVVAKLLGYRSVSRSITVRASQMTVVNLTLVGSATVLSGVVTTAMGERRRIEVGNDITKVRVDSIMEIMPVATLSDLLATRVPGLVATPTSGQPGAPTRIRIRGVSSINTSNDPIVIIDGVQVDGQQMEPPNPDLGGGGMHRATVARGSDVVPISPLDQIDPNSIETIEVLKGPSAVAMYGSDAANGVIVITTKRGSVGAPVWTMRAGHSVEFMPGKWPSNYYAWGHDVRNESRLRQCVGAAVNKSCIVDSIVKYQPLNDPHKTIFGHGSVDLLTAGVTGGRKGLTYSITGSAGRTIGLTKLPDADVELIRAMHLPISGAIRRPQSLRTQGMDIRVETEIGKSTVSYTSKLSRNTVQRSPLSEAPGKAGVLPPPERIYDASGNELPIGSGFLTHIPDYRKQTISRSLNVLNAFTIRSNVWEAVPLDLSIGQNTISTDDRSSLGRDECVVVSTACPGIGSYYAGVGTVENTNGNLRGSYLLRTFSQLRNRISGGFNYTRRRSMRLDAFAEGLPVGAVGSKGAEYMDHDARRDDRITAGMYLGTELSLGDRFFLPLEFRKDVGSAIGDRGSARFPRLSFSYVLSDEPQFQSIPIVGSLPLLRLRLAYGQAGKQPRVDAAIRTYKQEVQVVDGTAVNVVGFERFGNPAVMPERSSEWEGGLDMDLLKGRVSFAATVYRKKTTNLLVTESVAYSAGGGGLQLRNLGDVLNRGFDISTSLELFRNRFLGLHTNVIASTARNVLLSLKRSADINAEGKNPDGSERDAVSTRQVIGYPLNSRWGLPIISYADVNNDGYIDKNEVIFSDSAVYLGAPYEKYSLKIHNTLTLFQISIASVISYQNGINQVNERIRGTYSRAVNDVRAPLPYRAHLVNSVVSTSQTISTLRFDQLSVSYAIPRNISRYLRLNRSIRIVVQGQNIGLITSYRGKDPNVGVTGESMFDQGQLPIPRTWGVSIGIN